jgi:hypothetical protein
MGKLFKSASISAQWKAIKANLSGDYPKKAPSGYDLYFQFVKKWLETCRFKKARNSNSTRLTHRLGCTFVSFVGKLWRSFPVARKNEWKAKAKPGQDQFTLNVEVWKGGLY